MNNQRNILLSVKRLFYSVLILTAFIAPSAYAQTPAGAANEPASDARSGRFSPQFRSLLMPVGLRSATGGVRSNTVNLMPMAAGASLPVIGGGTLGRLTKWGGFTSSHSFIGDSTIYESKTGLIGMGTDNPGSKLTVVGMIETTMGGLKFPDGTVQSTAGLASIFHDVTLTGSGTAAMPLGVAIPLTLTGTSALGTSILAVENQVGDGVTASGGSSTNTTAGSGVVASGGDSISSFGGVGVSARGGDSSIVGNAAGGGSGILAAGGSSLSGGVGGSGLTANGGTGIIGGLGVFAIGGTAVGGNRGGTGVLGRGGDNGGLGVRAQGGTNFNNSGGIGLSAEGGDAFNSGTGGNGARAVGGRGLGAGNFGGTGIEATGGPGLQGAATGLAGKFNGDVEISGVLNVLSGTKNFKIDHPLDPENKYLYHAAIESSEVLNVYSGNVITDQRGEAVVTLPDWFEALNKDFRYQLTPIGAPAQELYIAEKIHENRFKIGGAKPRMEVSWQVTGIRSDAAMRKQAFKVEEVKPERERGYYLQPEAFNQPVERSIEWARNPEAMRQMRESRARP